MQRAGRTFLTWGTPVAQSSVWGCAQPEVQGSALSVAPSLLWARGCVDKLVVTSPTKSPEAQQTASLVTSGFACPPG